MLNRNVKYFYTFSGIQALGRGIWMGNILSLFIVMLAEEGFGIAGLSPNELLGVTSAITGLSLVAIILPGGLLADKWSREGVLKIAGLIGLGGLAVIAFGNTIMTIMTGLFLWGMFQGLSRPAAESILANSLETGRRSLIYARAHMIEQFGMASGPVLNILLFFILGDAWDLGILKNVMLVGIVFSCASVVLMLQLKDAYSLNTGSEAVYKKKSATVNHETRRISTKMVPFFLIASSFIIGTGAGMTVKFFPVFFRDIYSLRPIAVQMVLGGGFFVTGVLSLLVQRSSIRRGRVPMIIAVQGAAIICLAFMATYPPVWVLIPVFIARGALMNAAAPLNRSIMMDFVPINNRGIWNSLQTIAWGLFWNASAALGGFLIGDNNYALCFSITAIVYAVGTIPMFFILPLVEGESYENSEDKA